LRSLKRDPTALHYQGLKVIIRIPDKTALTFSCKVPIENA
jgi:hypothetical protein